MKSADGGLTSWPARHPWLALFIAAIAAIASILGILHMSADASVQSLFPRGDPAAAAMARVLNEFPRDRSAPGEKKLTTRALEELTEGEVEYRVIPRRRTE